jgi:hypothetical protein
MPQKPPSLDTIDELLSMRNSYSLRILVEVHLLEGQVEEEEVREGGREGAKFRAILAKDIDKDDKFDYLQIV